MRHVYILLVAGSLMAASCTPLPQPEETVHIGMATALVDANPVSHWAFDIRSALEEDSFEVRIYPSSTLGTEIEREEQTMLGLLQINVSSGSDVMQYSDRLKALRLPFLFDDASELHCLMQQADFLDAVNQDTEPRGLTVLGIVFSGGMAGLYTTNQPVRTIEDLGNRRIRAMDRAQVATISAWGASAVSIPWEEIQTALQTGIAGGYINPPSVALQFRHERQVRHFLSLDAFAGFRFVTASTRWLEALTADERRSLEQALDAASISNFEFVSTKQQADIERLIEAGIEVTIPSPQVLAQFRDAAREIYPALAPEHAVSEVSSLITLRCRSEEPVPR